MSVNYSYPGQVLSDVNMDKVGRTLAYWWRDTTFGGRYDILQPVKGGAPLRLLSYHLIILFQGST